jgi:hypothetical protein
VHPVSPTQAGETLTCACGRTLTVPTLREIRSLEPLEQADRAPTSSDWNVQKGSLFVGGALLLAIAALATWRLLPQRQALNTSQPAFQEISFDVHDLDPLQAWEYWEYLRKQTLEFRMTPEFLENRAKYRELSYLLYAVWAAAAVGLALIAASLVWPGRPVPEQG